MLEFFRRYQRFFFLIITIVIIVSFSFFGTYSTLANRGIQDPVAFVAVDGTSVYRSEVEEMAMFIGSDAEDKLLLGGVWGPNFFNDGVIKKDLLATGLADLLVAAYREDLAPDFKARLEKEKRYIPYTHPQGKYVSASSAWSYFAPELKSNFDLLRSQQDPLSSEAFSARSRLFLAERGFPAQTLKQVLRFQQQQYNWLMPDPRLEQTDLSLFGYRTLEDWFGPRFLRLAAELIINGAKLAEEKGYKVTRDEALADLIRLSRTSFEQNHNSPFLGLATSDEYFQEQLRLMGMDQSRAIHLWQQVLLFRRLFHDFGDAAIVDTGIYKGFLDYTNEFVEMDLYQLPKELQLANFKDLQQFEIYLQSVSPSYTGNSLKLPTQFLSAAEIEKKAPELVQKRYFVEIAGVDKQQLQSKVGIKDMWNWEVDEANWKALTSQFPELAAKNANTRDERFKVLDQLDSQTRSKVDQAARQAIVDAHPEWLSDALAAAPMKKETLGIRKQGGTLPIEGLKNSETFANWLDEAPIASKDLQETSEAKEKENRDYTADQRHYYRIRVLDRASQPEVLTFSEALQDGTLNALLTRTLDAYYATIRGQNPHQYQKIDLTWKPLSEVQETVAQQYFAPIIKTLQEASKTSEGTLSFDQMASKRLSAYVNEAKKEIVRDPAGATSWYMFDEKEGGLASQWKLQKITQKMERNSKDLNANLEKAFGMTIQEWSSVLGSPDGALFFFQLKQKGSGVNDQSLMTKVFQAHRLLSADAQRMLLSKVLAELQERHALSLDFMKKREEG